MAFVHLHVHTYYSLLDGQSAINKIVDKAIADGMPGVAITDHGNMFGVKELFDYCASVNKNRKKEGLEPFKPIFGCEMYVARRTKEDKDANAGDRGGWHLIVLAKNEKGYRNLIKLVSRSWVDGFYGRPRTDHTDLEKYHEGLIICSACIAGEVPSLILKGDIEGARKAIKWHKDIWGDDYYLELQRHRVTDPGQRANRETYPLQEQANKILMELAREFNVKLICSNDVHFVDEENAEAHDHLLCLSTGKDLDDPSRMLYSKQEWFKTQAEMERIFSDVPEALVNTLEVLEKVENYNIESDPIMPFFPIPDDFGTEDIWRKTFTEEDLFHEFTTDEFGNNPLEKDEAEKKIAKLGGYEKLYRIKFEADFLGKLAYEGASRIYGYGENIIAKALQPEQLSKWAEEHGIAKEVDDRIRFELHIMKTMGFPGYFLIVQDFINSARKELDVWVGPGRGSAAGSVVAYCLGITKIDPLKYDLLFERFLNPDRISLPDIDTDFDDDGRGRVLQWVMDKYGHENCAHIITYGTMATKNSIKDVARVEKLPLQRTNEICKAIPDRLIDENGNQLKMNLGNAIRCTPLLREAEASGDTRERNTIKYARMLEGTVRNTGIHACGFIICRDPISDHVPVSTADDPDFPEIKTAVTQYDGHVIESTGLIKMDFLGLKTLSEQKEACRNVKQTRGIDVDLDNIPIDDELTYQLYQRGQTIGTFQFESTGMQKYLKELHPTVFEDLIAMNALYRPGPMDYIPSFIARKNGREPISYDIDCMEKYLKDTYGITVYQEQVMLLSRQLANFTRGESDALRKAMGKKKKDIVDKMKPKFIEGGVKNGHDPKVLEKIWADWEKFASYAFNKSHAACYSWVAYQTAYLKAHYPAEFMAALLTRRSNDIKEINKLMDECRTMKIETLSPDVNESYMHFSVNKKGNIRFGLAGIKGVGENAVRSIIEERDNNGPFVDPFDFVERVNLNACNKKNIENLILSGAFDCFTNIRREQYFTLVDSNVVFLDTLISYGQRFQQEKTESSLSLFSGFEDAGIQRPTPPQFFTEWSNLERLNKERDLISIYLSGHPLDEYAIILKKICTTQMQNIGEIPDTVGTTLTFGGIVLSSEERLTKRGQPWGLVKIEDYSGPGELRLFGDTWAQYRGYFTTGSSVFVTGNVQSSRWGTGDNELVVAKVEWLADVKDSMVKNITICCNIEILTPEIVSELIEKINKCKGHGETELRFNIGDNQHGTRASFNTSDFRIGVTKDLIDFIDATANLNYVING